MKEELDVDAISHRFFSTLYSEQRTKETPEEFGDFRIRG